MYLAVQAAMPHESELVIDAHRYVEETLIPKFMEGMPVDIVQHHHEFNWTAEVLDILSLNAISQVLC